MNQYKINLMTTTIAITKQIHSDNSKTIFLWIDGNSIKITQKQMDEIVKIGGLNKHTDFNTPNQNKSYQVYK